MHCWVSLCLLSCSVSFWVYRYITWASSNLSGLLLLIVSLLHTTIASLVYTDYHQTSLIHVTTPIRFKP